MIKQAYLTPIFVVHPMIYLPPYSCRLPRENSNTSTLLDTNMLSQISSCVLPWHLPTIDGTKINAPYYRQGCHGHWWHTGSKARSIAITLCDKRTLGSGAYPLQNIYHDIKSYPLFADADKGNRIHAASQCHARPKTKLGISMLSVYKFPYTRKQTRGKKFTPCRNDVYPMRTCSQSFKCMITLV